MTAVATEATNALTKLYSDPAIIKVARKETPQWEELRQVVFTHLFGTEYVQTVYSRDGICGLTKYVAFSIIRAARFPRSVFRREQRPTGAPLDEDIAMMPVDYEPDFCVRQVVERLEPKSADLLIIYAETGSYRAAAAEIKCAPMTAYRGIQKAIVEAKKLIP